MLYSEIMWLDDIKWTADGLVPAIAQESGSGRVLTLAWMNRESAFGEFLARQMSLPGIQDYLELGHDEALIEIEAPQSWIGKSLADLQLHRKKDLTVLAIKGREKGGTLPQPETPLQEGDILVVGGPKTELDKLDPADV